ENERFSEGIRGVFGSRRLKIEHSEVDVAGWFAWIQSNGFGERRLCAFTLPRARAGGAEQILRFGRPRVGRDGAPSERRRLGRPLGPAAPEAAAPSPGSTSRLRDLETARRAGQRRAPAAPRRPCR